MRICIEGTKLSSFDLSLAGTGEQIFTIKVKSENVDLQGCAAVVN